MKPLQRLLVLLALGSLFPTWHSWYMGKPLAANMFVLELALAVVIMTGIGLVISRGRE